MRFRAALLALMLAVPAAAQDVPEWVGLWAGRVGTLPVHVCLESYLDGPGHGSYYYLSQLEPIRLAEAGEEGGWIERTPGSEAEAAWDFATLTATHARGVWRQGDRRLDFELTAVPWNPGEWGGPCSSFSFLAPRLGGGRITSEPADLEGWRYTRKTYRPPASMNGDVAIASFSFIAEQPGDAAINHRLAGYLPEGRIDDSFVDCLGGAISSLGTDGFFEQALAPRMVSRPFLTVELAESTFCGGAHPNHGVAHLTLDRQTGAPVDLHDWVGPPADEYGNAQLSKPLRAAILARWPDQRDECREYVVEALYWDMELARAGLSFTPMLPHVVSPCEEAVMVSWTEVEPFLDEQGLAELARLRGN